MAIPGDSTTAPLDLHAAVLASLGRHDCPAEIMAARRRIFDRHAPEPREDRPTYWTAWCSGHDADTKWPCADYLDTAVGLPELPAGLMKDWPPSWDGI